MAVTSAVPVPLPSVSEAEYQSAERGMMHRIGRSTAVTIPAAIVFFGTLLVIAASIAGVSVVPAAAAGAVIGLLAGVFAGMWVGVCMSAAEFERLEGHPHRPRVRKS